MSCHDHDHAHGHHHVLGHGHAHAFSSGPRAMSHGPSILTASSFRESLAKFATRIGSVMNEYTPPRNWPGHLVYVNTGWRWVNDRTITATSSFRMSTTPSLKLCRVLVLGNTRSSKFVRIRVVRLGVLTLATLLSSLRSKKLRALKIWLGMGDLKGLLSSNSLVRDTYCHSVLCHLVIEAIGSE